jgi:hypothetical protein
MIVLASPLDSIRDAERKASEEAKNVKSKNKNEI